jgi:hypothetical protein
MCWRPLGDIVTFAASRIPTWVPGVNCTPNPRSNDSISRAVCAMTKTCFRLISLCSFDLYGSIRNETVFELTKESKIARSSRPYFLCLTATRPSNNIGQMIVQVMTVIQSQPR